MSGEPVRSWREAVRPAFSRTQLAGEAGSSPGERVYACRAATWVRGEVVCWSREVGDFFREETLLGGVVFHRDTGIFPDPRRSCP